MESHPSHTAEQRRTSALLVKLHILWSGMISDSHGIKANMRVVTQCVPADWHQAMVRLSVGWRPFNTV